MPHDEQEAALLPRHRGRTGSRTTARPARTSCARSPSRPPASPPIPLTDVGARRHAARPVRRAVPVELRHAAAARRAEPRARRRRRAGPRRRRVRHARLARPGQAGRRASSPPQDVTRGPARGRTCRSPPGRSASRPTRPASGSSHRHHARPAHRPGAVRGHHRQVRRRPGRSSTCGTWPGSNSAASPTTRSPRAAACDVGEHPDLPAPRLERPGRGRRACGRRWRRSSRRCPPGMEYSIPFDTTKFVDAAIDEVYMHAVRGRRAGADRHPRVPPELAGAAGPGDDGAGHHHRRVRVHAAARLLGQPAHAVRADPRHRHRGGRRHRDRRERRRTTSSRG